jgi:EAL domain-containing protein (putative c-di-GMP-specific phosphodiesterase class I)
MSAAIQNNSIPPSSRINLKPFFTESQAERMIPKRLRVCIPQDYYQEPVLSRLTYDYGILVNITSAMLGPNTGGQGWFDLELRGTPQQILNGLVYLQALDLKIWHISHPESEEGYQRISSHLSGLKASAAKKPAQAWGRSGYSEKELRRAVKKQEFQVYYQPIVSLASGRIDGFEALVRWLHPQDGLVAPADFIPLAESTGLIIPIEEWVIGEACRQLGVWQSEFPTLTMSVNVSGQQFLHANLIGMIAELIEENGLEASRLQLEITETAIAANTEQSAARANHLKALGVELAIDDFGTGYSSLSRLYNLPVDVLKIDRSFVSRMESDARGWEIVQMMVKLAHHLGLEVIAEGIETSQQLAALRTLGCECGQGYLFSKPLDREATGEALAAQLQW